MQVPSSYPVESWARKEWRAIPFHPVHTPSLINLLAYFTAMGGPPLDGMEAPGGAAMGAPAADASEAEDPLLLLSLPPPSSLCRFISQQHHAATGSSSKQRAAAKSAAANTSKKGQQQPVRIAFDSAAAAPLTRLSPSLLPEFLRRHFLPSENPQTVEKQQLPGVAASRECVQHPMYTARVSELSPLAVVLLLSLVARLRQRQQQQQQQQVIGSCLLYAQRLAGPPPQSLLQQMHAGRPFVCFCCSRRFSTSAAKLLHLERHMRRRMQQQQQQQQQAGGRHSTASSRSRVAAASSTVARQPWTGVSSWIEAASTPFSGAEPATPAMAEGEGGFYETADTYAGLKQRKAAAVHALSSLARAEARQHEAQVSPPEGSIEGPLEGHREMLMGQRRFPSWVPPFVAIHLEDPAAGTTDSGAAAVVQGGSAPAGPSETAAGGALANSEALAYGSSAGPVAASRSGEEKQHHAADLASVAAIAAQEMQQHEMRLWQWCFAAADFKECSTEWPGLGCPPLAERGLLEAASRDSDDRPSVGGPQCCTGGPQCISASPRQWIAALMRLGAALPPEDLASAAVSPGEGPREAATEEQEQLLQGLRQCAAAADAAATAAAAITPARVLLQEGERFRRCYLCGCSFSLRLEEQQQQYYLRDAVVVLLLQRQHHQQLSAAVVAVVAPAVRCAANNYKSSTSMQGDVCKTQEEEVRIVGLAAAAEAIAAAPVLRLAAIHPVDTFGDTSRQQQQEQQQQQEPKYLQLSSRIGAQPAALSVALDVEAAVLLQQTGEGAPAAAAAAAGGRAAGAADAAAAEAAYRSLVSMEMADGELEPMQQEMLALLRQQLPGKKHQPQRTIKAAATQQQTENIIRHGRADAATIAAGSDLTVGRVLPTNVAYVHCDCYQQHLRQQGSFLRLLLLLLLLSCSRTQQNEQALRAVGQMMLQLLAQQEEECSKRKHRAMRPLPEYYASSTSAALSRATMGTDAFRKTRRRF